MDFNMLFYIIFGINLLIGGLVPVFVFFAYFRVLQKRNTKWSQTEWNLRDDLSWTESNPEDFESNSGIPWGGHEAGGRS